MFCGHGSETNGSSRQKRVRLCLACRAVIWYEGRNTAITGWKKRKILTAVSIIHLQPILKEKREEAPDRNFYRLRKWIMGRVTWIKTDSFFLSSVFLGEKQKQVEEEQKKKQRERERASEKESEEEKEESGGGTQRGKWCSKHFRLKSKGPWFNPGFNTQGDHPP